MIKCCFIKSKILTYRKNIKKKQKTQTIKNKDTLTKTHTVSVLERLFLLGRLRDHFDVVAMEGPDGLPIGVEEVGSQGEVFALVRV